MDDNRDMDLTNETDMDQTNYDDYIEALTTEPPKQFKANIPLNDFNPNQLNVLDLMMKEKLNQEQIMTVARSDSALYDAWRLWSTGKANFYWLDPNNPNLPTPDRTNNNNTSQTIPEKPKDYSKRKEIPDNEEFQYPEPRLTTKKIKNLGVSNGIETANKFKNLTVDLNLHDNSVVQPRQSQETARNKKIKPIHIFRTDDYRDILEELKGKNYKFQARNSGMFLKIFPETEDDHRSITQHMQDNEIQGYILPIGVVQLHKVVIRGLPIDTDPEDIKKELIAMDYPVVKVVQIISRRRAGMKMPLFQIQLQGNEAGKEIDNLTELFYLKVVIEKYNSPYRYQQCHKCQYFHHHSNNCLMKPRCAKCAEIHATNVCPLGEGKIDPEFLKCANCLKPHPANWKGCEKHPKIRNPPANKSRAVDKNILFSDILKRKPQNEQTKRPFPRWPTEPNGELVAPSIVREQYQKRQENSNNSPQPQFPPTNDGDGITRINALFSEIKSLLNIEKFSELEAVLENALKNMKKAKSMQDRVMAFSDSLSILSP